MEERNTAATGLVMLVFMNRFSYTLLRIAQFHWAHMILYLS